jgi:hypothetical protein
MARLLAASRLAALTGAAAQAQRSKAGLELVSDGAERRNYPEAKPKREGQKGRPACKSAGSKWM